MTAKEALEPPENSDDNNGPELIPQPHGGALLSGGWPGNAGGGRPPSVVRAAMREALAERIGLLAEIADDEDARPSDRIKAIEALARYGLGQSHEVSGPDGGPLDVNAWTSAARAELLEAVRREGPHAFARRLAALVGDEDADEDPNGSGAAALTVEEVAFAVGRAPSTVRRWLGAGDLEGWKIPSGEWRVPCEAVEEVRGATG